MRRLGPNVVLLALLALSAGCQQQLGRPPVPRFTIEPPYIAADDNHATDVTLDATASADELDDPDAPLEARWSFDDEDVRIVDGSAHEPLLVVTASGARAVTIVLTVTDPDGLSSSLSQRLGITLPEP